MRFVTRNGLIRILLVSATLFLLVDCSMCQCGRGVFPVKPSADIPAARLRATVQFLAGDLGEHNVTHPQQLKRAEEFIEREWRAQGYEVNRQTYRVDDVECSNLEVILPGQSQPNEIIVVGAHYDSVEGCSGANDNGSGVAALLELTRYFAGNPQPRSLRFVAFVNEEPPYYETDLMGSRVYAKACRQHGDDIRAMVSLETIGYYSDAPGSQKFPSALFKLFYPSRGNFVGFVGNFSARKIIRRAVTGFRGVSDFPVECCATFEKIAGIGWSDHASFWREGYPAFQISDTAPFRYEYYHTPQDTPDKLNYPAFARVTRGVLGAVTALAAGD